MAGRQQQPTLTRAHFGQTWYLASSRLPAKPWPSVSTWEAGEADPSQPLVLALLASRQPDWVPAPEELGLTLRFSSAVTQVPREGLSCTWAPLALEPAALGTEGAAGTVSPTPVRTRTPCQVEGEGRAGRTLACKPAPSTQALCTDGGGCFPGPPSSGCGSEASLAGPLTHLLLGSDPVAQLLRAIVSTTCSSLLRSRCRRACSSFSRAVRISSLYLVM